MYSQQEVIKFAALFQGAKEFYGTTLVGEIKDGKAQSTSTCIHEPPSPAIYLAHLQGTNSIGISPLKADSTIQFGAIDIDDYQGDLMAIVRAIWDFDMPICPCYSKSKKLHLYFFFPLGAQAEDAVDIMRWYARAFACSKKVEVFPKQLARTISNKAYSWINLPYFDASSDNHRKMVKRDGSTASLEEFIERAELSTLSIEQHKANIERYPCHDAPPCILSGALLRDVGAGQRNNWLFSAAVYFKLKDDNCDMETLLLDLNSSMADPLPEEEVRNTVLKSLSRKTYFYMCGQLDRCDKLSCKRLEHGIKSSHTTGLQFGTLKQIMLDPPQYDWQVSSCIMHFYSESELLGQNKFRELALRELHIVPPKLDESDWAKILNKAAKSIEVQEVASVGNDFTTGSRFVDLVVQYFSDKRKATNESQIRLGRVYADEESKTYWFSAWSLLTYIKDTNGFKGMKDMEIRTRLCDMGAYKEGTWWKLPMDALPEENMNSQNAEVSIDLNMHEGESEDF